MRRLMLKAAVLAALTIGSILLCRPAHAAPADALRLYAGANAVWLDGPGAEWPADWEGTANASASLSPHVSLTGDLAHGFTHDYLRWGAGARVAATDASNPNFNIFLGIEYRGGSESAVQPSEWASYAGLGWRPSPTRWPNLTLGAKTSLGLDSDRTLSTLAFRYMLPFNLFK